MGSTVKEPPSKAIAQTLKFISGGWRQTPCREGVCSRDIPEPVLDRLSPSESVLFFKGEMFHSMDRTHAMRITKPIPRHSMYATTFAYIKQGWAVNVGVPYMEWNWE